MSLKALDSSSPLLHLIKVPRATQPKQTYLQPIIDQEQLVVKVLDRGTFPQCLQFGGFFGV
jgi:hypothetical protein